MKIEKYLTKDNNTYITQGKKERITNEKPNHQKISRFETKERKRVFF